MFIQHDQTTLPRRPLWLAEPCPPWCADTDLHRDDDSLADRLHVGGPDDQVPLSLLEPYRGHGIVALPAASVAIMQGVREAAPRFELNFGLGQVRLDFSSSEARRIAELLLAAVEQAEGGAR